MQQFSRLALSRSGWTAMSLGAALAAAATAHAAPVVSRLTPPSALFTFQDPNPPYVARFLPGQRFDVQATVQPDAGETITGATFSIDGSPLSGSISSVLADAAGLKAGTAVVSLRAVSIDQPGVHVLTVLARQSDGQTVQAKGNFEVIALDRGGRKTKNVIVLIGDGMGIAHRTAARLMSQGAQMGKANAPLAMDTFPYTGLVMTHSLNSIVTDSAPGAACYSSGNKCNNNQEGVFPDDTKDRFDNPRVELIGEYLHRTQGTALGIVTTADVFDATPAAFAIHTQDRGAGTGIIDQYLNEGDNHGLKVLLGGGRKWFLPSSTPGSARNADNDYVLPDDVVSAWGVPKGTKDPETDVITKFTDKGFAYAPDATSLKAIPAKTKKLLGLFSLSNMNVAKDKIDKRRNPSEHGVVDDYGFADQPMLDEMTDKALRVLSQSPEGFVLMVEGASIDKQAHNMDSERWILDTIEFDRAVAQCRQFAEQHPDTLVLITADHECAGINIIGASLVKDAELKTRAVDGGVDKLRNKLVGVYDQAGFPVYETAPDGYPVTTDVDYRMLIGYAANSDRYEDWLTNPQPIRDGQQPFNNVAPLNTYPKDPLNRDVAGKFLVTGQVPGSSAVHTASDIPVSAFGRGASVFTGVMDNTDVFFKAMQAVVGGVRPRVVDNE